jgi:hypothetical protein
MLTDLYDFKEDLGKRGIFFCLSGPISQNLVAEIGSTLEQKMKPGRSQQINCSQSLFNGGGERSEHHAVFR